MGTFSFAEDAGKPGSAETLIGLGSPSPPQPLPPAPAVKHAQQLASGLQRKPHVTNTHIPIPVRYCSSSEAHPSPYMGPREEHGYLQGHKHAAEDAHTVCAGITIRLLRTSTPSHLWEPHHTDLHSHGHEYGDLVTQTEAHPHTHTCVHISHLSRLAAAVFRRLLASVPISALT